MFLRLTFQSLQKTFVFTRSVHQSTKSAFQEVRIPVPWGHIAAKWWGRQDRRPILAVHGWQDNAGSFDKLAPLIYPDYPMLVIDLPGHGFSNNIPSGYPYFVYDYVIAIKCIQDYYKWKQITLLGHSMGSFVCMHYAATFPNLVDFYGAIDALSSKGTYSGEIVVKKFLKSIDKLIDIEKFDRNQTPKYTYEECLKALAIGPRENLPDDLLECLMPRAINLESDFKYSFLRDIRLKVSFVITNPKMRNELFKLIKCHVLSIRAVPGINLDTDEGYRAAVELLKQYAKSITAVDFDGHHFIHLTEPEKVAKVVIDSLNNIERK